MDNKIYLPIEVFAKLPKQESDDLQNELMIAYFKKKPEILNQLAAQTQGDADLLETLKEKEFEDAITKDYAYDVDILRERKNDPIASRLVEVIDMYNKTHEEPAEKPVK